MAPTPPMSMSTNMRLLHISSLPPILPSPTNTQGQNTRNKKEDAIHDPKRKAGFQHRTLFFGRKIKPVQTRGSEDPKIYLVGIAGGYARAVLFCDAPEFVDACDEGTDETEVDETDEEGVVFGAVVGEEGCDGPGGAEHGDDEEEEDVGWSEGVVAGVDVDEVCEHAKGGDQSDYLHESPKGEENPEKHLDEFALISLYSTGDDVVVDEVQQRGW